MISNVPNPHLSTFFFRTMSETARYVAEDSNYLLYV